ncbi:Ku protein [Sphaerisporangium sp. NPDC051017]|uniref:non-homologous end joining protein Ku n=1 Tax=Sphaerisporangium sp. NPDC051017 TaxID=3154636 RepID=UPI00343B1CCB
MRSIWKGAISFGLVTIPVKLYSATEQKDVTFHQVHREDAGRIKYKRVCSIDGEEVPYSDIAKGYELPGGEVVVLTDEDFADLPLSTSRRIDVLQFTPADRIDPILFNKSYYLEPENTGVKPYILLREALERTGQVAIVKVALRQRESLATLRIRDGVFVLETMLWPDEVREPGFQFKDEDIEVRPQELRMAESLIETMAGEFDPSEYRDSYREALQEVIEAKIQGKELARPEVPEQAGPAVDLMAALRASVDAAKREREGGREKAPAPRRKAAAKGAGGEEARAEEAGEKAEKGEKKPAKRRPRKTA